MAARAALVLVRRVEKRDEEVLTGRKPDFFAQQVEDDEQGSFGDLALLGNACAQRGALVRLAPAGAEGRSRTSCSLAHTHLCPVSTAVNRYEGLHARANMRRCFAESVDPSVARGSSPLTRSPPAPDTYTVGGIGFRETPGLSRATSRFTE